MKIILTLLKNIKNLSIYFIFISVYFLFIFLDTQKEKQNENVIEQNYELIEKRSNAENKQLRIKIPVIPYKK